VIAISFALAGRDSAASAPAERGGAATLPGKNGRIAFRRFLDRGHSTAAI
jgi:hypothetical protein